MEIVLAILVFNGLIFAGFCAYLATEKGRDVPGWFILGFLFGIFALLALGFSPTLNTSPARASSGGRVGDFTKKCPKCAEEIKIEAIKCRFCGTDFQFKMVEEFKDRAQEKLVQNPTSFHVDVKGITPPNFAIKDRHLDMAAALLRQEKLEASSWQSVSQPEATATIEFACPMCSKILLVPRKHVGMSGQCRHCGSNVTVTFTGPT